jgi:uncharacterized protein (TIGR02099 family)
MKKRIRKPAGRQAAPGTAWRWKRFGRHAGRLAVYAIAALLVLLALVYAGARWYLPELAGRKADVERTLSQLTSHRVRIEKLTTYWDGLSPGAHMEGVRVYANGAALPSIRLAELRLSVAVLPLVWGEVRIATLRVTRPRLAFERLADGRLRVAGFDPIEPQADAQGDEFLRWLFRQRRLEIENGEFQWLDRLHPGAPLPLTNVNLTLRNDGERHRLGVSARLPPEICRDCRAVADVTGNPLLGEAWDGEVYLRAQALDLERLPGVARERLPGALRGRFDVELWSQWADSRPRSVTGHAQVAGLSLPVPGLAYPLSLREASGDVRFSAKGDEWELGLERLALGLRLPVWQAGSLQLRFAPTEQQLRLDNLQLNDIAAFAAEMADSDPSDGEQLARWRDQARRLKALAPAGQVKQLALTLSGPWGDPRDFRLEAAIDNLKTASVESLPGVENLSGQLALSRERGEFRLASQALKVALPKHFRAPLPAGRVNGRLKWQRGEDHWQVDGRDLAIDSEDGKGNGELALRLPDDGSGAHLKLQFKFRDGDVAHASRYYPVPDIKAPLLKWLNYAFVSGRIESGTLLYEGRPRDFPFREGQGRFEITGRVSNLVYGFLPGWEPLTDVQADVRIADRQVLVAANGRLGQLVADRISVVADLTGDGAVHVGVRVQGPLNETLRVLRTARAAPGESWKSFVPAQMSAEGGGALHLAVDVPYGVDAERVAGEYRPVAASVRSTEFGVGLESITGRVAFTGDGPTEGQLQGRLLGGTARVTLTTPAADERQLTAQGSLAGEGIGRLLGPEFASRLSGEAAWKATLDLRRGVPSLRAEVDLPSLKSRLPAPLHRPGGLTNDKLVVQTERATRESHVVALGAGQSLGGRLVFARQASGWGLSHGEVRLGEGQAGFAADPGLTLRLAIDEIDIDRWLPYRGGGTAAAVPPVLSRVSADVRQLDMFGRRYGAVAFEIARDSDGWSGTVAGTTAAGRLQFRGQAERARVEMDLAHLVLPAKIADTGTAAGELETDPRQLPRVSVRAREFRVKELNLGELDFLAEPRPDGWRIARFNLSRPETKLGASGLWSVQEGRQECEVDFTLESRNLGETANALGLPEQLDGGEGRIRANLSWSGSPASARASNVSGMLTVHARNGRFLQLKQGAARLFGILDLNSIGNYLLGNFKPIFGSGFGYETIDGSFELDRGDAVTRDLHVKGASARIGVNGRVGLAAEDFDMVLVIDPQITSALTLGSWYFLGPQVAAAVLAVQKVFKKQITEGTRVSYLVRGSWKEPSIVPLEETPGGKSPSP